MPGLPVLRAGASPASGTARSVPRRMATSPDMLATDSLPDPPPSVPVTFFELGPPADSRPSKSLWMWPDMERRVTAALVCAGSRIATSPETVPTRISPAGARSTSAVTLPLTVLASSRPRRPSASVRSPDTDLKATLPSSPWASRLPETVFASTAAGHAVQHDVSGDALERGPRGYPGYDRGRVDHAQLRRAVLLDRDRDVRRMPLRPQPPAEPVPGQVLIADGEDARLVRHEQRRPGHLGHVKARPVRGGEHGD